eukprot:2205834-Lingulodinium_polyedra.AAC.1
MYEAGSTRRQSAVARSHAAPAPRNAWPVIVLASTCCCCHCAYPGGSDARLNGAHAPPRWRTRWHHCPERHRAIGLPAGTRAPL